MNKKPLGNKPSLYPMPVTIVGANVENKPNFMTIAFIGAVNSNPGMIAIGANRNHITNKGILANKTFSVNVPSQDMLEITDYVGIYSGTKVDKSGLFEVFYGKLLNAPMIKDCPLNLECKVLEILEKGGNDQIIIGEIIESYSEDKYLTDGNPDISKMKPALFSMWQNQYFAVGEYLGNAWSIGKNFRKTK
jgi:flavin reductase (DIM6/NTAB) family NADH-FMN oxidoreductase RutF